MLKDGKSPEQVITHLYTRTLSREPTAAEKKHLLAAVAEARDEKEKREILSDIFWALLNSKEFIFNH